MKRAFLLCLVLATTVQAQPAPAKSAPGAVRTRRILSRVYSIDRKYRSMEGPGSMETITLGDGVPPELLWLVGVRTEMVAADGRTPQLPELMCHVNVDIDASRHQTLFNFKRGVATRVVTLSQGMLEARLPPGFGFPIASNEPLVLYTQVLNHNIEHPNHMQVRHLVTFEYVRDRDLVAPIQPLFNVGASGMVLLDDPKALASMQVAPAAPGKAGEPTHGASCLILPRAPNAAAASADYVDPAGRHMTGHWTVPPGKQVNRSDITWFMKLPYDTRLHYAAVHLHPFALSLTMRDVTEGRVVFAATATGTSRGVGLSHVDTFRSAAGRPLFKDHEYELISVYDNTTQEDHDSMASIFLGLEDLEFQRPEPAAFQARAGSLFEVPRNPAAVVRTTSGDFAISLLAQEAPEATRQFLRLARSGFFAG